MKDPFEKSVAFIVFSLVKCINLISFVTLNLLRFLQIVISKINCESIHNQRHFLERGSDFLSLDDKYIIETCPLISPVPNSE